MLEIEGLLKAIPYFENIPLNQIIITKLKGLTNKNILLQYKDANNKKKHCVLRVPQDNPHSVVNRNYEKHNRNLAYKLGLAPKTLWQNEQGMSLTEFINNAKTFTDKDLSGNRVVADIAKLINKLHHSNADFKGRLFLNDIAECFNHYLSLCSEEDKAELKLDHPKNIALCEKIKVNDRVPVPSHIDLVVENILIQSDKLWIIDWEYSAMASPFWDLASVCNNMKLNEEQSRKLLQLCLLDYSETDYKCLENYQQLEQRLSYYWLKAFKPAH